MLFEKSNEKQNRNKTTNGLPTKDYAHRICKRIKDNIG
jgi:hypothetical protein